MSDESKQFDGFMLIFAVCVVALWMLGYLGFWFFIGVLAGLAVIWFFLSANPALHSSEEEVVDREARKLKAEFDALFGQEHHFSLADVRHYSHLNLSFYQEGEEKLRENGFEMLGDLQNDTVNDVYRDNKTFIRVFVSEDGAILAGIFHLRIGGLQRLLAPLFGIPQDVWVLELDTEFSNGQYVVTENALGINKVPPPEGMDLDRVDQEMSWEQMLARHRGRVQAKLRELAMGGSGDGDGADDAHIVEIHSMDEAVASADRKQAKLQRAFERNGGVTQEFWDAMADEESEAKEAVFQALQRLYREEGIGPNPKV